MPSSQTPYAEHMQTAFNDALYKAEYEKAEEIKQKAEENYVTVVCEECKGKEKIIVEDIEFPCYCVPPVEENNEPLHEYV